MLVVARETGSLTNYSEKQDPAKDHRCHKGYRPNESRLEEGMQNRVMHVGAKQQPVGVKAESNQGRTLDEPPPLHPNGRTARNFFEIMYARMASRVGEDGVITQDELDEGFTVEDIPEIQLPEEKRIGFHRRN